MLNAKQHKRETESKYEIDLEQKNFLCIISALRLHILSMYIVAFCRILPMIRASPSYIYAVEVFSQMVLLADAGLFYESRNNEMKRDRYSQRQVFVQVLTGFFIGVIVQNPQMPYNQAYRLLVGKLILHMEIQITKMQERTQLYV